ncbi:MAG: hypothetical protein GY811_21725 [Myxococcales bacterium]|nr:hypothetical protein [Myxococcales bacterium]
MSVVTAEALLELLEGDQELLESLVEHGIISREVECYGPEDVETVLVSRTLVRELEVNWAGVDVILRLRRQLLVTRLRLAEISGKTNS